MPQFDFILGFLYIVQSDYSSEDEEGSFAWAEELALTWEDKFVWVDAIEPSNDGFEVDGLGGLVFIDGSLFFLILLLVEFLVGLVELWFDFECLACLGEGDGLVAI